MPKPPRPQTLDSRLDDIESRLRRVFGLALAQGSSSTAPVVQLVRDDLTAYVDGLATILPLSQTLFAGTAQVYLNGLLQIAPDHYVERSDLDAIEFSEAPLPGDVVIVIYAGG